MRYINQHIPNAESLKFEELREVIKPLTWIGDTPNGTNLKSKILEPLVYRNLPNNLKRPLLVSIITDGMPSQQPRSTLPNAVIECGDKLEEACLPRESKSQRRTLANQRLLFNSCLPSGIKFMVSQVGTAKSATEFLEKIRKRSETADVVFGTADKRTMFRITTTL